LTATSNASYGYDNNGNTTSKTVSSNTTNYTWDYENRLTSVTPPGSGGTVSFKYDPFGRRIYKSSGSGTSVFAYDGDNLVEETNSSGTVVARYSQALNIDEPLAMLRGGATSFYNADGLGTVASLANSSGTLAQTYTFHSFGTQTALMIEHANVEHKLHFANSDEALCNGQLRDRTKAPPAGTPQTSDADDAEATIR